MLTAIPMAGFVLLYNSCKYSFSGTVVGLYCIICSMYSFAFVAHSTLSAVHMSCTLTAVLTNGVYTLYHYSYVTNLCLLQSRSTRAAICVVAESVIVVAVLKLPYMMGPFGGVPTLTVVQTPAVLLATFLVKRELDQTRALGDAEKATVFELLLFSGVCLCAAMAVSFVELAMDRESVCVWGCFRICMSQSTCSSRLASIITESEWRRCSIW